MEKKIIYFTFLLCSPEIFATKFWLKNERPFTYRFVIKAQDGVRKIVVKPNEDLRHNRAINTKCVDEVSIEWGENFSQSKKLYSGSDLDQIGKGHNGGRCDGFFYIIVPQPLSEQLKNREEPKQLEFRWS